jgi:hypothetical protein
MRRSNWTPSIVTSYDDQKVYPVVDYFGRKGRAYREAGGRTMRPSNDGLHRATTIGQKCSSVRSHAIGRFSALSLPTRLLVVLARRSYGEPSLLICGSFAARL